MQIDSAPAYSLKLRPSSEQILMTDLAGYTLVPANGDQILVSRKRQVTTWARGMTEEQFLNGEVQLDKYEHAVGKMVIWVLVPRDDPQTLEFKCSCKTFRRQALVRRHSSRTPEEVIAYGIASVFCPPENRKKGYASHMMRLLHHVLSPVDSLPPFPQEWGAPPSRPPGIGGDAQFSVLYSDVGDFYKHCGPTPSMAGWHIHTPVSTIWKLKPEDLNQIDAMDAGSTLLSEQQCIILWDNYTTYITNYISQLPVSPRTKFTFLPDKGVAAYLLNRVKEEPALHPKHPLEHWGVTVKLEGHDSSPAYATWSFDLNLSRPPALVLTVLRASPEAFPSLIKALHRVARQIGANTIDIWNLDAKLVDIAASLGGDTGLRKEHLPAAAWYGPEQSTDIEWVFNEKFPWC